MIQQTMFFILLLFFSLTLAKMYHQEKEFDLDLDLSLRELGQINGPDTEVREQKDQTYAIKQNKHLPHYQGPDQPSSRESRVMNSLTQAQKDAIVNLHNKLRRGEGASNMEILRYNEKLATLAQGWAQRCVWEHGNPPFTEADVGYKKLGQNIYVHSSADMTVEQAVQEWYDEKPLYDFNTIDCNPVGSVCRHYTAVTWAKTTDIGCGIAFCPSIDRYRNAHFLVCNYATPANSPGDQPFKKGPACTQCDSGKFFCNNGLCDKSCTSEGPNCECKAACKQCGKRTSGCGCECKPGTMGSDCSDQCKDLDPKCGANPGYLEYLCTIDNPDFAFVPDKCPKLCKKCSSARSMTCSKRSAETMTELKRLMINYLESELDQ